MDALTRAVLIERSSAPGRGALLHVAGGRRAVGGGVARAAALVPALLRIALARLRLVLAHLALGVRRVVLVAHGTPPGVAVHPGYPIGRLGDPWRHARQPGRDRAPVARVALPEAGGQRRLLV